LAVPQAPASPMLFSYRGRDRSRPIIGDRRPPSPLGDIQPAGWLAEYTTELLNVLNVLGLLIKLEPKQADFLKRVCAGADNQRRRPQSCAIHRDAGTCQKGSEAAQCEAGRAADIRMHRPPRYCHGTE
jgi:hypothetical protein